MRRIEPALEDRGVGERQAGPRLGEPGVERNGPLEGLRRLDPRLLRVDRREAGEVDAAAQVGLVGFEVRRRTGPQELPLGLQQVDVQLRGHPLGDVGLDLEDLVRGAVVALRPQVGVVGDPDELRGDADVARPA